MITVAIAFGHFIGALVVMIAFYTAVALLGAWELRRNQRLATEEVSIALGIPMDQIDDPENQGPIVRFLAERFSTERFQNRLSDLCWWLQAAWNWAGSILMVGVFVGVGWFTITEDTSNALYVWWGVLVAVVFWITSVAFAFICRLFTGRFPGQARQARKMLATIVKQHSNRGVLELTRFRGQVDVLVL